MRSIFLLAFAVALAAALSAQPSSTFFSTFDAERGNVVTPAAGGYLWLGGQKDERVLLTKLNAESKVLDKHSIGFEGTDLDLEHLTDLFEETDGTLVGCGNFEGDNLGRGFVFRYNPASRQMVWAHIVRSGSINYLLGITQLGPGGNYVLYGQTLASSNRDAELLLLDRNSGLIVPGKSGRINLGLSDRFSQVAYHDGALYAGGHLTVGAGIDGYGRTRHAVCKLDTATLQPVWSRMGPIPTNVLANLQGRDLIVDDNALISTFGGNTTDPDLPSTSVFLQKNDLSGNLLWARQYDLPEWNGEFSEEVIALPDGYLLYGHDLLSDTSRLFLLKTDKDGNAQWARKIVYDYNDEFPDHPARSKILRFGDALFLTALSQNNVGQTQGILLKTDLDGAVADSCDYLQPVAVFPVQMPSPVSEAVVPVVLPSTATLTTANVSINLPDLSFSKKCGATGTCPTLPDLRATLDSITCTDGDPKLYFTVCNIGGQPYDGPFFFYIYDKNPLTDTARLLTGIISSGDQPILPGDCFGGFPLTSDLIAGMPFELDTFSKLYSLIGTTFSVQPPIPLSGFPYSPNRPECNYLNNLDSISVPKQLCGDCKTPVTFVKKLGEPQRRELAFSLCAASDGNVYLAGKQGDNPMIAKITTRGEQIWVRNFPPIHPNEPIEWAQIIEDSDGMLVLCGTEGASPSNRRAIVMRYDPVAGAVLWYKRYTGNKPVGAAIVEKNPGGNFVLQTNYQTLVSGSLVANSEFFTLNRADGNTIGSSVGYQNLNNSLVMANTVMNNGSLYTVGSWNIKATNEVQPFFAKVSPSTFIPEWAYHQVPDTASGAARWMSPSDVAFDGDIAVIAGSGQLNPLTPTQGIFVFLEKHNPDGSLAWMKRYDMAMVPEEVLTITNAYIVFGRMVGTNQFGMLKTDVHGNVLQARILTAAPASPISVGFASRQSLILPMPLQVLMLDHTWEPNESDLVLVRTDLNFGMDDDCVLLQNVPVNSQTLTATSEQAVFGIATNTPASVATNATANFQADSLPQRKLCPACPCEGTPDVSFGVASIFCAADSTLSYRTKTCNAGDAAVAVPVEVVFYDKNPLTEAAQVLWSISVNQSVAQGACAETAWSLPTVATQYSKIYTFAGVPAGTPTPIDLNLLAADSNFPDCQWANNLDSFVVQTPVCDGCENPTTFIKTMGRVDQSELGYSLCTAADGTVYMAGRQDINPMITKMSPNGDVLWVRNFPAGGVQFNETVELVEIFEDTDGKLVLCGTEGKSPNSRIAVAMRYDPVADQVLWYNRYSEQNPHAAGIFEKTPGGNFVLHGFSEEFFPGGPPFGGYFKARSHVWEISRATGEVVPPLLTYFGGTPSIYLHDMVHHNGNLYATGSWRNPDVSNSSRPILAKLSVLDAAPEWIVGVLPDTAIPFQLLGFYNVLADADHLLAMGHGVTDVNMPTQKNYIFLSKYTLDGALLWMKSYEIAAAAEDIVALPDGYAIFGRTQGNSWVLLKTDKDGNLLKTRQLTLPVSPGTTFRYYRQKQLLRLPNHLLVVDDFKDGVYEDIVLFKTDYDLNFDTDCDLVQPVQVATKTLSPLTNLIFTPHEPYLLAAAHVSATFQPDSLNITQICPQCPCTDKPDLTCRVENLTCSATGDVVAKLRVCNLGFVETTAGFNFTFYDKNPLTGTATALFATSVPVQPGFGDCIEYELPLGFNPKGYAQIFTLAGVWSDVQTPVAPEGFPYPNGFAECDYANNVDSFVVVVQGCSPDSCQPETYLKHIGRPGRFENMSCLRPAPNGNLYLAGRKGNNITVSQMTPDGQFLGAQNIFKPTSEQIFLSEFIVDSEGMMVGCGVKGEGLTQEGFVFRYDPNGGQVKWAQRLTNIRPSDGGILEKSPGGNFLLYQNANFTNLQKDAEILELDRATGQIVPAFARRYNQHWRQSFNSVVAQGNALYAIGFTDSLHVDVGFLVRRMTLTQIDAATGDVVWSKAGHLDWEQPAYLHGTDLIVDANALISLYYGNESNVNGQPTSVFLQKSTLTGDVLWVKRFEVPGKPKEIVAVPDGYIILVADIDRYLLKTDKAGNLLLAKKLINPPADPPNAEVQNQILVLGSNVYIADYAANSATDQYTSLLKTDLNLGIGFSCNDYVPVQIPVFDVANPINLPTQQNVFAAPTTQEAVPTTLQLTDMTIRSTCPNCPDPPCTDKPDVTFQIESIGCDSAAFVTYRLCNTGKQPFAGTLQVGVYDSNPMTSAAILLDVLVLQILHLPPDSCQTGTWSNLANWKNYPNVYTLAGIVIGQITPVDPAGFPYNGIAECDYANNLDSVAINPNLCQPDSCQPKTFIKRIGKPGELENMSCLRPAPDGNLYLGGHKGRHIAISKMTPQGEFLWTRTLFEHAYEQIFLSDMIVDSEGMIVGMSEKGLNISLEGFVFRYNPETDQMLWAHQLNKIRPRGGGIIEKKPSGNFLFCQNANTSNFQISGEILELNRTTGQIVPTLAKRYYQNWRQSFLSMVAQGDSLYTIGSTDSSHVNIGLLVQRMTLSKINAATGDVVWTKSGHTDWEQPSHFVGIDVIVDGSALVSVYYGNETDWASGPRRYMFLQKSTLNGDVLWVKRYHFPGWRPKELIAVPDGYVIMVEDLNRYLLKTDKDGNLLAAKMLVNPQVDGPHIEVHNQMQVLDGYLFVADYAADSIGDLHTTLLKTDLNLDIEFSCDNYVSIQAQDSTVVGPINLTAKQTVLPSPTAQQSVTSAPAPADMTIRSTCPFCPDPPCTDKPDIAFEIESVGCDSAAFVTYRLCNIGATPYSGPLEVGVYESNPLTGAAILLDQFTFQVNNLPSDSCQTGSLKNLSYWGNYSKVFTLAGIESGQITPVDPAGFPYNGIAECDYANNLDSLIFQYPPPPPFDLGPNAGICPGDTLLLGAGLSGFVSYTWQDGSTDPVFVVTSEGLFSLTTRDGCGRTASDNIVISLKNQPKATREIVLLPGDSVVIDGKAYTASGTVISYAPSATGGCDTLVTNKIHLDSLHCERPGSFFKTFKGMSGRVVAPAADGGYYVGGSAQGHALARFDATGKNLWVRSFDFFGNSFIQTLIEDSEGMLVGSATSEGGPPTILVFRYNPMTDQMLWIKRHSAPQQNIRGFEVVEKNPGGDFLLVYARWISTSDFNTHIITFDRTTGDVTKAWRYIARIALSNIEVHQNALYAAGVLSDTTVPTIFWRGGLVKIDLNTGALLWSRLTKTPGTDLLGSSLVVDSDGNIVSTMAQSDKSVWLQKTTPNGDLLWLKKIEVNDPAENQFSPLGLVRTNDGYAIGIQTFSDSIDLHSYIVVKTDKNGDLLWAKKVPKVGGTFTVSPHQLASRGNEICFTTNLHQQIFQYTGMVLGKFDKHGNLGESCSIAENSLVSITAQVGNLIPGFVQFTGGIGDFNPLVATPSLPGSTLQNTFCSRCLPPCDSIAVEQVIEFYPGDTVTLAGTPYTQPDTVTLTLSTDDGCDSVVTYILRLVITNVDLVCPANLTVSIPANQSSVPVSYPLPAAATDCPDPGIAMTRLQGPPSGGLFPEGTTQVCYEAANQCGIRDTCCFSVTAQKTADETACDVKMPPGSCIKFELLNIRLDALGRPRYRMRLTNTCASPVRFAWFQLPNGMWAKAPANDAIYTAPSGNTYLVRNPSGAPYNSIRFQPQTGTVNNGKSEIFEYTLPKQAQMAFILVSVKLEDGTSFDAHVNTFDCPWLPYVATVQEPKDGSQSRNAPVPEPSVWVRPNPTTGFLFVDLQAIAEEPVLVSVLNAQGQLVLEGRYPAENNRISLRLPEGLANGLYYLRVQQPGSGQRLATRFVLER